MHVTVSDSARATCALVAELSSVDKEQLEIAAQMAALVDRQIGLARKSRELHAALSKLVRFFSNE